MIHRLLGRCLRHRKYRYENAAFGFGTELKLAIDQRKQCVVFAEADVTAGMPLGAALARNNVAREDLLAAENLDPKPLAARVAAVA
jgi:hypothetical protein